MAKIAELINTNYVFKDSCRVTVETKYMPNGELVGFSFNQSPAWAILDNVNLFKDKDDGNDKGRSDAEALRGVC